MLDKKAPTQELILDKAQELILERGFVGTSIDDILAATGLSKGAFFYHFKSKADLAKALIERFVREDMDKFGAMAARADVLSDDPLQSMLIFLKLLEESFAELDEPLAGCVLAAYLYQSEHFDPLIVEFVSKSFKGWEAIFTERFKAVLKRYKPKVPLSAEDLAQSVLCLIEGGIILSKAYHDPRLPARQIGQQRKALKSLFE